MIRISAACTVVAALAVMANTQQVQLPSPAVPLQPLAQQVRQMEAALSYLGQPFSADDLARIDEAIGDAQESEAVKRLQSISVEVHDEVVVAGAGLPGASQVAKADWIEVKRLRNQAYLVAAQQK